MHAPLGRADIATKTWMLGAADVPSGLVFNGDVVGLPAPEQSDIQFDRAISDPCGDTESSVDGDPVATPRLRSGTDLEAIGYLTTHYGDRARTVSGLDIYVKPCDQYGDQGVADHIRVDWIADEDPACDMVVGYVEVQSPPATREYQAPPQATYGQDCHVTEDGQTAISQRFREELSYQAVELTPTLIRIRLHQYLMSEEAASTLTAGSRIGSPTGFGGPFGSEGGIETTTGVDAQLPVDHTEPGPDLILG